MRSIAIKFSVGDTVYVVWPKASRCPTCGQYRSDKTLEVIQAKISSVVYQEGSNDGVYNDGLTYGLSRTAVPYKSTSENTFATRDEAEKKAREMAL